MTFKIKVEVTLDDASRAPLTGLTVRLLDKDMLTADDLLGSALTDATGVVSFSFEEKDFADIDDRSSTFLLRRPVNEPELYVELLDRDGKVAVSTRKVAAAPDRRGVLSLRVPVETARRHGLVRKARTRAQKAAAWRAAWEKRIATDPKAPIDLCASRVFVDLMAGLAAPKTDLQKQLSKSVRRQLTPNEITIAANLAREARATIDGSGLLVGHDCAAKTPGDLVNLFFGEGGAFNVQQALWATEPPALDQIGTPRAGRFRSGYNLADKCKQMFDLGQLTGRAAQEMAQVYGPNANVQMVLPPTVAAVDVWSPFYKTTVRHGDPASKILTIWKIRDQDGLGVETCAMDVAVAQTGDPDLLVAHDGGRGRQPLILDVHPLQQITLTGRGFAAEKADMVVEFARWLPMAADQSEAAALSVGAFEAPELWPGVGLVKGAASELASDKLAFEWPADRGHRPGLYRMRAHFPLPPGKKVTRDERQDEATCEIGLSDRYETAFLYFAVLPPISPVPVKALAPRLHCAETTHPRFWPDDMGWMGATSFSRLQFDVSQPTPTARISQETAQTWDVGSWRHLDMPADWSPERPNILPDGQSSRELTFGNDFHDLLTIETMVMELDSDADRAAIKIMLKVAVVLLAAIVVALTVVVAVVAAIAIVALSPLTGEALLVVLGIVAAAAAAWISFVLGTAAALLFKGVDEIVDTTVVGAERIASGSTTLTAIDVAVLTSKSRFIRRSLETGRVRGSGDRTAERLTPQGISQDFEGARNGGCYRMTIDVSPAL